MENKPTLGGTKMNKFEQTDIFSMFNIVDEVAERQKREAEEKARREAEWRKRMEERRASYSTNDQGEEQKAPVIKQNDFNVKPTTVIMKWGEQIPLLNFFTEDEILNGIGEKRKKIDAEAVRKRMFREHPDMVPGLTTLVYAEKQDIIVVMHQARKKGCTETLSESDSVSDIDKRRIPFTLLQDFMKIAVDVYDVFGTEIHADIYWSKQYEQFVMDVPFQNVHRYFCEVTESPQSIAERMLEGKWHKVAEIHSHHTMSAKPSPQDDESEIVPGIFYVIVGRIQEFFPEITVRIYDDMLKQHILLSPDLIFERPHAPSFDVSERQYNVSQKVRVV
jgi:hypothetical protein